MSPSSDSEVGLNLKDDCRDGIFMKTSFLRSSLEHEMKLPTLD